MFKRSYVFLGLVLISSIFFSKAGFAISDCRRTVRDMVQSKNSEDRINRIDQEIQQLSQTLENRINREIQQWRKSDDRINQRIQKLQEEEERLLQQKKERILKLMLELVRKNPKIQQKDMAEQLKLPRGEIHLNIKELEKRKWISRIGNRYSGYWKIHGEEPNYLDPNKQIEERILELVRYNPAKITQKDMVEELGLTISKIQQMVQKLEVTGQLLRIGNQLIIPEYFDSTKEKVLELMREKPNITREGIAKELALPITVISQMIYQLQEEGRL